MKKLMLFIATLTISAYSFADTSSGFSKHSSQLNALGLAWKSQRSQTLNKHEITMGYGGEDISRRPTLIMHTTVA